MSIYLVPTVTCANLPNQGFVFKGATKLYSIHYSRVVIILFCTGLEKSAFSAYSLGRNRFVSLCVLGISFSISLVFSFHFFLV